MNAFNKITTRAGLVIVAVALVAMATGMTIFGFLKSGVFPYAIILPVAAIVYGCVAFVKKYYPKSDY